VTVSLDDRVVDVRLAGRDVNVVVTGNRREEPNPAGDDAPAPPSGDVTGDISRITLRLLDEIKTKAEKAAATQGVSLNAWVSQAVQGALHGRGQGGSQQDWGNDHREGGQGSSRVRGWVRG
jgi:hypothetical protein